MFHVEHSFMHTHNNCPVCKNNSFTPFITCKDYTVSHKNFNIVSCSSCGFKFTNPIPSLTDIGNYYKSEDYISHSNTKKGLISQLYHLVRSYTLKGKLKLVSNYVAKGLILDYGCGTGMFLNECDRNGWKTYGTEPDAGARAIANAYALNVKESKAELINSFPEARFNAITLWHVLEHVTDIEETLNFFKERLATGGVLVIAVPNYTSFDSKHYKEFWAAYDVPRHLYHFNTNSISQLLNNFDFELVETRAMKFDSFYVSMLSEKYMTGKINYLSAFFNGLRSNLKAKTSANYSSVIFVFKLKTK
jgi:2-polyprenyl-3-methyl-5-hydroxy-6-metoxy-1,4-benzoquinol methylase